MFKILQVRLQQYVNQEIPDVQAEFRKGRGTRYQITNICWVIEKAREVQKNIYSASLTMPEPFTVWVTTNWIVWNRWEYQITLPVSWETSMLVKKQQLEADVEQWTGSNLGERSRSRLYIITLLI